MQEQLEPTIGRGPATDPEGWLDRHGDGLYRYALARLRDPDAAADLVQETFLEALRSRENFEGRSSERTWLIGILRHKVLDHLRRSGRERAAPVGDPDEGPFDRQGFWRVGPARWGGDPAWALERREFWGVFGVCLAKLPSIHADAFLLRELEGLDAPEVCQLLGISPVNLWARLHRARLSLRDCLERNWFGVRSKG